MNKSTDHVSNMFECPESVPVAARRWKRSRAIWPRDVFRALTEDIYVSSLESTCLALMQPCSKVRATQFIGMARFSPPIHVLLVNSPLAHIPLEWARPICSICAHPSLILGPLNSHLVFHLSSLTAQAQAAALPISFPSTRGINKLSFVIGDPKTMDDMVVAI